jgi:ATP-dependent Clp protease ATP-binding subunit ClpX
MKAVFQERRGFMDDENRNGNQKNEITETSETDQKEEKKAEKICFLCRRPESVTGPMIDLPGNMHVCRDCMQKSLDTMRSGGVNYSSLLSNLPNVEAIDLSDFYSNFRQDPAAEAEKQKKTDEVPFTMKDILPPHKIKAQLDRYVIGQEQAKKIMSVAVYNHYKRIIGEEKLNKIRQEQKKQKIRDPNLPEPVEIEKSNMLMIGPTGSGKTYLVQTMAKLLDVPLALTDATSLTEAGYIGDDIESVVSKLLAAAGNDVSKAEHGIIFIDEIDKIAKKKNTNQRDVSGEAVQQGMLKLLEGSEIEVPVGATSKNAMVPLKMVNTKNILFICGGAFPDLKEIIKERLNREGSIGFHADLKDKYDEDPNIMQKVTVEDLRKFGMIPEFLGRLPIVFSLEELTEDMLVRILREPQNAILKQYEALLAMDEVKLTFEDAALRVIAKQALEKDTGARALRAIIEGFMTDIMYEVPKDDNIGEVIITREYIEHKGGPKILLRGQSGE